MKQPDKIVLFFPHVVFILCGKRAVCCWLRPACIVNLLSLRSTGGVSSFSVQSIQNVSRNPGLFSTVGTFSLIYLSAGWIYVELGFLSPCKLHYYTTPSCRAHFCQQAWFPIFVSQDTQLPTIHSIHCLFTLHSFYPTVIFLLHAWPHVLWVTNDVH